jgi:hypothetical protein
VDGGGGDQADQISREPRHCCAQAQR